MEELRVLELYSGIGGMHYGLELSGIASKVVAAIDINPQANLVYTHNFKNTKLLNKTIEGIKLEDFNKLNFDMILMSPPCQPFTRQGNQNGAIDPRAKSFLSLIEMIPKLAKKPRFILMENVKGFDEDQARDKFIDMLKSLNYTFQEFLLSPIQFGIPNSRLRYFLIARLEESFTFETQSEILKSLPEETLPWIENLNKELIFDLKKISHQLEDTPDSKEEEIYKNIQHYQLNESYLNCAQSESKYMLVERVRELNEFVLNKKGTNEKLFVTEKQFETSMNHADFVTVKATRTCCFTKNYGRFMDGTGSILLTNEFNEKNTNDSLRVNKKSLRFLTPREVANLHCFPNEFEFPDDISTIQGWRLIGNSLNVFIVGILIKLMTK